MQNVVKTCVASASELKHSELYISVKAVLFTTPSPNLNGVRCTEAFIDEIVANQEAYVGLPLNADIQSLESGQYDRLGHMFDQTTGTFATAIIGSFYKFEKEKLASGETALIGYARIMKRNKAVCSAVGELFANGNLKFSFEISCGKYTQLEDGTMLIDASEDNYLEGMCIVWSPACPMAVAKELVAELTNDGKEADKTMEATENTVIEVAEETVKTESAEITAEAAAETVDAEVKEAEAVNAEAEIKTEEVAESKAEDGNGEAGKTPAEEAETEEKAEDESGECKKEKKCSEEAEAVEVKAEEDNGEETKETEVAAVEEDKFKEMADVIAELTKTIKALEADICELKEQKKETVVSEIVESSNPFMADISLPEKKYSLLDKEEKCETYTLLERA